LRLKTYRREHGGRSSVRPPGRAGETGRVPASGPPRPWHPAHWLAAPASVIHVIGLFGSFGPEFIEPSGADFDHCNTCSPGWSAPAPPCQTRFPQRLQRGGRRPWQSTT